jgi:hypothetical protein
VVAQQLDPQVGDPAKRRASGCLAFLRQDDEEADKREGPDAQLAIFQQIHPVEAIEYKEEVDIEKVIYPNIYTMHVISKRQSEEANCETI